MHQVEQWLEGIPAVAEVETEWFPKCEARIALRPAASITRDEIDWAVRRAGFATLRIQELEAPVTE